ncbi:MAG: efflux RND transporter permease subunit [Steroidobacteraceae bacterium]
MNLPRLSIRRHVLTYMVNGVLVLFGIIGYQRIGVDRFPQIEYPVVSVTTALPGGNPEIVDTSITNVIETSVNSIPGIDFIQSSSSPGVSTVSISFSLSKNVDVAFNEVQAKVNQVLNRLPDDADPPIVAKVEIGAAPVMWLALQGDRTLQQLNQYARNVIKKRLETIDGVGEVRLGGERLRTIRVNLDVDKMAAFKVTAGDVRTAFTVEHLQFPGGFLVDRATERLVKLDLEFHSPAALGEMILRYVDGAPVRLRDVATVEDGLADFRQIARFQGKPTVGIGIVKVSNANTVAIVEAVRKRVEEDIIPQLPAGMTLRVALDDAELIEEIVAALGDHLIEGTVLAALVVWLFLRSFRSTLIIATAIPVSLLGAVALMYFLGYTFNNLTLLGLLLLIGVVVDDAIVVLENIFRHREDVDPDPLSAAINGTDQVAFAVVAASLTLVSIFGSVLFLGGIIGRFFESFAVVVAAGVLVSLFVSLTLTPMLCSRYLKVETRHGRVYRALEQFFDGMDRYYRRSLDWTLAHRWKVIGIASLVVLSSGFFFASIGKTFLPDEDEGRFVVTFRAPLGANIETADRHLRRIETVLASHSAEVQTYFTVIGLGVAGQVNRGTAIVRMVPRSERDVHQEEFIATIRAELAEIPGIVAFVSRPSPIGGQRGDPLQFSVVGPELNQVAQLSQLLYRKLSANTGLGRIDLDVQLELPQTRIQVDRTRAADLGLSAADVALAVNMLSGGVDIAKYNDEPGDGQRYDIRAKAAVGELSSARDLRSLFVRTPAGEMVRLDTVVRTEDTLGAAVINRYALQYAANFFGTPTIPLGEATAAVQAAASEILPPGYQIALQGQARELAQTTGFVAFAFVLALVLIYMVLASQFDSFIQPFVVMVAQPLAIIGGLFALWITGNTLNIFSMIGLVLLIGLVAKNSILLVDLSNQLREKGKSIDDALREACPIRMRPVLMTSLTVILALLPAALGLGAGADTNGPLAIGVIGGMVSSTLLTLVVVPAVYSLVEGRLERRRGSTSVVHPESAA